MKIEKRESPKFLFFADRINTFLNNVVAGFLNNFIKEEKLQ